MEEIIYQGIVGAIVGLIGGTLIFGPRYIQRIYHKSKANNGNINSMHVMGNIFFEKGKYEDAIPFFLKVNRMKPNLFEPVERLAFCYYHLNRYEEAKDFFKRLVKEESSNAEYFFALGYCYYKLQDLENAMMYQSEAIRLNKKLGKNKYI